MFKRLLLLVLLLPAVAAPGSEPPARSVQVFFDDNMQVNWAQFGMPFTMVEFKILAYDLVGDISAYRFRFECSDADQFVSLEFPAGVVNVGTADEYILEVQGGAIPGNGVVVLATGAFFSSSYGNDIQLCLGPIESVGPGEVGLAYRPDGSDSWVEMELVYPGCAVLNPYNVWPTPIPSWANTVTFDAGIVGGEPTDPVRLPIRLSKALLKAGTPSEVGRLALDLAWDPAVAEMLDVFTTLPEGWTVAESGGAGALSLVMEGANAFDPGYEGSSVVELSYRLGQFEGETDVVIDVVELLDANGIPIDFRPPDESSLVVTCRKGDVVPNSDVNALDALLTLEIAAQVAVPDPKQFCRADMNGNLEIESGDAAAILAQAVGLAKRGSLRTAEVPVRFADGEAVFSTGEAAGCDLLVRWDPSQGELLGWETDPSFRGAHLREDGSLRLALARTETSAAEVRLRFDSDDLSLIVDDYRLWAHDGSLLSDESGVGVDQGPTPTPVSRLLVPYPNPANPSTKLRFVQAVSGWAEISVQDARGRRVWSRHLDDLAAGEHAVTWEGVDAEGRLLPSGTYLVLLRNVQGQSAGRISLIR